MSNVIELDSYREPGIFDRTVPEVPNETHGPQFQRVLGFVSLIGQSLNVTGDVFVGAGSLTYLRSRLHGNDPIQQTFSTDVPAQSIYPKTLSMIEIENIVLRIKQNNVEARTNRAAIHSAG